MFTTRPEIQGTFGVVSSTHWLASAVGMGVLERGGNAFDAAVATGFTLQVVEPHLNGPAGEVPILLHDAGKGGVEVLCGQGVAPAKATVAHFKELGLDLIPGTGLLPACVPGAFDAWMLLLRDHGTWPVRDVLEPAMHYLEHGHPLLPRVSAAIDNVRQLFEGEWRTSAAIWLPGGNVPQGGRLFRNPKLAATYARIVEEAEAAGGEREAQIEAARAAFYKGFVAEAIAQFCESTSALDVSGDRHHGLLTGDDLASWQASYEKPLTYDYHGYTLCKTGPWGQGPILLQLLALLQGFDLDRMDPNGRDFVHTVVECLKLAFADREAYYGDPNFVDVPVKALLGVGYNNERRQQVSDTASFQLRPGVVRGFEEQVKRAAARRRATGQGGAGVGEPTMDHLNEQQGRGDTCHVDVIDRHGNVVSATPSGGWLQSSPAVPELGFCLGTRAQMFWLEEGLPNSLAPGKRPRTTLTPSLALRDGKPHLAFGTPGGDQQDQWQALFFLRHVHHKMNLQQAIDAPLFHTVHFPSSFYPRQAQPGVIHVEASLPQATVDGLRDRGHEVVVQPEWSIGRLCAAAKDGPLLKAAATPRLMQAYAIGR